MPVRFVALQFQNLSRVFFSFNAPFGSCPDCDGLGVKLEMEPASCDCQTLSCDFTRRCTGALESISSNYYPQMLEQVMTSFGIDMGKPFEELAK